MVNSFFSALLDGLFPQYCSLCGLQSRQPRALCAPCKAEMAANSAACLHCGLPLPEPAAGSACGRCLVQPPVFSRVEAPWLYDEYMAFLIRRWKFHREQQLTPLLAQLWLERAGTAPAVDLVVPVPLHWRRRLQRGYNQAELLARELLRRQPRLSRGGLARGLLVRSRATPEQSGLPAGQRERNLLHAFTARGRCDNLRIALVDDVLTTGATASEAAATLLAAGAREVHIWCLARTPAPDH